VVYVGHFKCNLRRTAGYPNLSGYFRDLYQVPGVADTPWSTRSSLQQIAVARSARAPGLSLLVRSQRHQPHRSHSKNGLALKLNASLLSRRAP
jgi:hypothetical protein